MTRILTNQKPNFHELVTSEICGNSIKIRVHSCQKDFSRNLFLFLILLSFPLQGCYSQEQKKRAGQAEAEIIDPYSWDFGQVKEGGVLKHSFVLKNESEKTMTIKDVNTSCGCTASKVEKKILLSGQSSAIEVQFNTKGYSGLTQQYVYVHTDSLDKPIIRFIIKADVIKLTHSTS